MAQLEAQSNTLVDRLVDQDSVIAELTKTVARGVPAMRDASENVLELNPASRTPLLTSQSNDVGMGYDRGWLSVVDKTGQQFRSVAADEFVANSETPGEAGYGGARSGIHSSGLVWGGQARISGNATVGELSTTGWVQATRFQAGNSFMDNGGLVGFEVYADRVHVAQNINSYHGDFTGIDAGGVAAGSFAAGASLMTGAGISAPGANFGGTGINGGGITTPGGNFGGSGINGGGITTPSGNFGGSGINGGGVSAPAGNFGGSLINGGGVSAPGANFGGTGINGAGITVWGANIGGNIYANTGINLGFSWIYAGAFVTNVSEARFKRDITPSTSAHLDEVLNAPLYHWRYRPDAEAVASDDEAVLDEWRYGPMADDLPGQALHETEVGKAPELTGMLYTAWGAIRELSAKVTALSARVDALEAERGPIA